jgi:hypothetical protein
MTRIGASPFSSNWIDASHEDEHLPIAHAPDDETPVVNTPRGGIIDLARLYASARADGQLHTADIKALVRQALLSTGKLEREDLDQLFDLGFDQAGIPLSPRAGAWLEDLLPSTMDAVVTREDVRELTDLRKARAVLKRALHDLLRSTAHAPLANLEVRFQSGYHLVLDVVTTVRDCSARDMAKRVRRVLRSRGLGNVRARVVVRGPANAHERAQLTA